MKNIKDRITNTICKKGSIQHLAFSIKKSFLGIACLLGFLYSNSTNAQQQITLNDAIAMALKSNNQIKIEKLKTAYAKASVASYADIAKTSFTGEFGQINSTYQDSKFSILQKFAFPTVYVRQEQFLTSTYNHSLLNLSMKEFEVKKAVTQIFYNYFYLNSKRQLLEKAANLCEEFYQKASLRLQKGESNILEKTTAQTQKSSIDMQLKMAQQELNATMLELQYILNQENAVQPIVSSDKLNIESKINLNDNPFLKILKQQTNLALIATKLEKSKLLPDITLGYLNNSFIGNGADNKVYTSKDRFNSVQVCLEIPLFFTAQKAKIKAAKIKESEVLMVYETAVKNLDLESKKLWLAYKNNLENVNYYEKEGLQSAKIISETANKQFINGDINYLDFVLLFNQSIAIQNNYIEALKGLNDVAMQLQYLILK